LDAAVALAAELEGDKVDAALLESRMRFAEDKLLQQVRDTAAAYEAWFQAGSRLVAECGYCQC
jgi:hypothetical protein